MFAGENGQQRTGCTPAIVIALRLLMRTRRISQSDLAMLFTSTTRQAVYNAHTNRAYIYDACVRDVTSPPPDA